MKYYFIRKKCRICKKKFRDKAHIYKTSLGGYKCAWCVVFVD